MRRPEGEKPVKITVNDFIVKSCAMALREVGIEASAHGDA